MCGVISLGTMGRLQEVSPGISFRTSDGMVLGALQETLLLKPDGTILRVHNIMPHVTPGETSLGTLQILVRFKLRDTNLVLIKKP